MKLEESQVSVFDDMRILVGRRVALRTTNYVAATSSSAATTISAPAPAPAPAHQLQLQLQYRHHQHQQNSWFICWNAPIINIML